MAGHGGSLKVECRKNSGKNVVEQFVQLEDDDEHTCQVFPCRLFLELDIEENSVLV